MLAHGTHGLPDHVTVEAEPVLVEAAGRLDPPRLRRVLGHLRLVADPDGSDTQAELRHQRRGVWLAPTWEGMVAIDGLLEPEAGQSLLAALEPLARPASADDSRSGSQRNADALAELAHRALEAGHLPQVGGAGPLAPEACQRLACDAAVTRVLVTRHPTSPRSPNDPSHRHERPPTQSLNADHRPPTREPNGDHRPRSRTRARTPTHHPRPDPRAPETGRRPRIRAGLKG